MQNIEIYEYNGDGYNPTMYFENWRVAFLHYAERFDRIEKLERHLLTDEVFVLLKGKGVLFVSSELTELMAVCDRIIVLFDGRITRTIMRKDIEAEEELQHAIQQEK